MTSSFNDLGASSNSEVSGLTDAVTQDAQFHDSESSNSRGNHQLTGLDALPTDEFLRVVGLRVRTRRSVLSMSRKRLAEVSGVSERYLAQLESGQGNMSIALLRKVTTAIGVTMGALLSAEMTEDSQRQNGSSATDVTARAANSAAKPYNEIRRSGHPSSANANANVGTANEIVRNSRLVT